MIRREVPTFQLLGGLGILAGIAVGLLVVLHRSLDPLVFLGLCLGAVTTSFLLLLQGLRRHGRERLVNLHHQAAILSVTALLALVLGLPVDAYTATMALSLGTLLALGRMGCLLNGCCHGRPHPFGIRYGRNHVEEGLSPHLEGVRLFPVQALESLWLALVVGVGVALLLGGGAWTDALAWYVGGYAAGRFVLEFLRGDPDRPHLRGLSEAQWTSGALLAGVAVLVLGGATGLPFPALPTLAVLGGGPALSLLLSRRMAGPNGTLWSIPHLQELRWALEPARVARPTRRVGGRGDHRPRGVERITSRGLRVASGPAGPPGTATRFVRVGWSRGTLHERDARRLAECVLQVTRHPGPCEVVPGDRGGVLLLLHEGGPTP